MKQLEAQFKEKELFFVVAGDIVKDLHWWDEGAKLKEEINFIILNRTGYEIKQEDKPKKHKMVEGAVTSNLSSTELRKRIKNAEKESDKLLGIAGLTTNSVIEMIKEHKMYF